jgi:hypothetical protein
VALGERLEFGDEVAKDVGMVDRAAPKLRTVGSRPLGIFSTFSDMPERAPNHLGALMKSVSDHFGSAARHLFGAWTLLPKHEHVPYRHSFDPMTVVRILPVITLLQLVGDKEWRFRLVGTEVDRRWRRPLTGVDPLEIVAPEVALTISREFGEVVRQPCGSWSVRRVTIGSRRWADIETLRLPLRAKDGSVSLIIGTSGELCDRHAHQDDLHRSITTVEQQWFFDIGAGVTTNSVLINEPVADGGSVCTHNPAAAEPDDRNALCGRVCEPPVAETS